jgi:hypothetical protein
MIDTSFVVLCLLLSLSLPLLCGDSSSVFHWQFCICYCNLWVFLKPLVRDVIYIFVLCLYVCVHRLCSQVPLGVVKEYEYSRRGDGELNR